MSTILSIDIGIKHMALVTVSTCPDNCTLKVLNVELVDLTRIPCLPGCALPHTKNMVDRMEHLFAWYAPLFAGVDEVLVEAQPPGGLCHVEALVHSKFRGKSTLVSPTAMHHHFRLPRGDYDGRKVATEALAAPYLPAFQTKIDSMPRAHDIADAVCMCLFVLQRRHKQHLARVAETDRLARLHLLRAHDNPDNPFSKFAHA